MKTTGIVVEYNPFHNGHLYHIQKAREITQCDCLVAVMSGNFTQRGEVAICDKFQRAETAVLNGVDLVIELPYIYATQAASKFAYGAIESLKLCHIDALVFGSESNNLANLKEISEFSINVDHLKQKMDDGHSYVKSYSLLQGSFYPNDILGIAYLKAIANSNIKPYTILRTNSYHQKNIDSSIASATAIREAIKNHTDYQNTTVMEINEYHDLKELYPYIRNLLLTLPRDYLQKIFLVSEGIEKHLINNAKQFADFDEFINHATTRRYTTARIQRTLLQIINQVAKKDVENLEPLNFIRVLAFNQNGQKLLKKLKQEKVKICTRFADLPTNYQKMSYKTTFIYSSLFDKTTAQKIMLNEIGGPIIVNN